MYKVINESDDFGLFDLEWVEPTPPEPKITKTSGTSGEFSYPPEFSPATTEMIKRLTKDNPPELDKKKALPFLFLIQLHFNEYMRPYSQGGFSPLFRQWQNRFHHEHHPSYEDYEKLHAKADYYGYKPINLLYGLDNDLRYTPAVLYHPELITEQGAYDLFIKIPEYLSYFTIPGVSNPPLTYEERKQKIFDKGEGKVDYEKRD